MTTLFQEAHQLEQNTEVKAFATFLDNGLNMSEALATALINQMGGVEDFIEEYEDIANHGANNGTSGFIWHNELEAFYKENKEQILTFTKEQAKEFGTSMGEMVSNFNTLRGNVDVEDVYEVLYADEDNDNYHNIIDTMCWFCLEELSRSFSDYVSDSLED